MYIFIPKYLPFSVIKLTSSPNQSPLALTLCLPPRQEEAGDSSGLMKQSGLGYGTWRAPDEGITLTWRDLSVYVPQKRNWFRSDAGHRPFKRVLNNGTCE